ncbi:MAG: class I SAM-dependent methyltransferase [Oscillospiraceae bacterium]|jgi:SAM-dependent methyltransferase|nr:class I SAM-dependent methyltransferase [Oscillospiraceae bacterium]
MSTTQEKVRGFYSRSPAREDARARKSRADGMEFRHTKLLLDPYITPDKDVVEFGCATGHYAEHWHGKCKSYLGVDITQENVDFFNAKGLSNAHAQLGDATRCPEFPDGSFDVVLCLGPMYHLPEEGRALAMAEMARICRPGGVLAFAYISKVGVLMQAMTNRIARGKLPWYRRLRWYDAYYPNRKGNDCIFAGVNDIDNPFFFTMPEEMEPLAAQCGLRVLRNAGVDITLNAAQINHMDGEQYACWLEFAEYMLRFPSVTGMAEHALMVCGK